MQGHSAGVSGDHLPQYRCSGSFLRYGRNGKARPPTRPRGAGRKQWRNDRASWWLSLDTAIRIHPAETEPMPDAAARTRNVFDRRRTRPDRPDARGISREEVAQPAGVDGTFRTSAAQDVGRVAERAE